MRAFSLKTVLAALLVTSSLGVAYADRGGGHGHDHGRGDHSRSADSSHDGRGGGRGHENGRGDRSRSAEKGNDGRGGMRGHDHDRSDRSRSAEKGNDGQGFGRGDRKSAHNFDNGRHNFDKGRHHFDGRHKGDRHNKGRRHSAQFLRDKAIVERNLALANGGSVAFNLANGSLQTADIDKAFRSGAFGPVRGFDRNGKRFHEKGFSRNSIDENGRSQRRHEKNSFAMSDINGINSDGSSKRSRKHQGMNDNGKFHHGKGKHAHRHHKDKNKKRFHEDFAFRFNPPFEADNSRYFDYMNMGPYPAYSLSPPRCIRYAYGACVVAPGGGYYMSLPPEAVRGGGGYGDTTLLTGRSRRVAGVLSY